MSSKDNYTVKSIENPSPIKKKLKGLTESEICMNITDSKTKKIHWLQCQGSTCRYDSFMTIFALSIYPKVFNFQSSNFDESIYVKFLIDKTLKLIKGDFFFSNLVYSYIWNILSKMGKF